jgi:hypothetical protein
MNNFNCIVLVHYCPGRENEAIGIYFVKEGDAENFKMETIGMSPVGLAKLLNIPASVANESGIGDFIFQDSGNPSWEVVVMQTTTASQLANYFGVCVSYYTRERSRMPVFQTTVSPDLSK